MIFTPYAEIANYVELEVECEYCGQVSTIPRPNNSACDRLIDGYYFQKAMAELELLKRAQTLFDSRPRSNHRYIIRCNYRTRVINSEDCSLLQEAIDADPPLKDFFNTCSFAFHPRLRFVENSVQQLRDKLATNATPCSQCGGALRLTEECHDACGGLFLSEEARLRWVARHKEWSRNTKR